MMYLISQGFSLRISKLSAFKCLWIVSTRHWSFVLNRLKAIVLPLLLFENLGKMQLKGNYSQTLAPEGSAHRRLVSPS